MPTKNAFWSKLRGRKVISSVVAIAVLAGVPITLAIAHRGFPVTDVDLTAQNVWVTNGKQLLGGRLNHQIGELDAKVNGSSTHLDVLQDGGATILTDTTQGTAQVIDPAFVSLTQKITIPVGAKVAYGANTLAILGQDGKLWVIDAADKLTFDAGKTTPTAKLGLGALVVASKTGQIFATSPAQQKLVTVERPGAKATSVTFGVPKKNSQLTAVGEHPVVLDTRANTVIRSDGSVTKLTADALRIQQAGPDNDYVLVATGNSLLEVPLGGGAPATVQAKITTPVTSASGVSAPVFLGGCAYGAWADAQKYLYACDDKQPIAQDIGEPTSGSDLEFRVNHGVIALNNLQNGNAWIASSDIRLVNNWAQVNPDEVTKDGETGKERPVKQSFEDAVANRTATNHPPVAVDDNFGARPQRTTVLPVLDNDTDEDGDVLTITKVDDIDPSIGTVDVIEGGRALQYTPPLGAITTASFRYTISDGRQAYASAQVNVTIRPLSANTAPTQKRTSTATVEVGQAIPYNVLGDFIDPDGDEIYLVGAAATTPDLVQFTADGTITFTSKTGQTGAKQVAFTISDGKTTTAGSLEVDVKPVDSLDPVAVPDFATAVSATPVVIHPLENDLSPSGQPLSLVSAKLESGGNATVSVDQGKSTIEFTSNVAGSYYLAYTIAAGAHTVQGIALVNVANPSGSNAAPIAVKDVAYVRPGEPTTVDVLTNDVSPSGRVLVVQSVDKGPDGSALNVEVLGNSVVRVTAPGVLAQQVQLTYVVSDGLKSSSAAVTVVPIPPLVNHQSPIATDDAATVRAGDIASVPVLDNDTSPDNVPFTLDPTLASTADQGEGASAFVSGSLVRYQAPTVAGTYSVTYGITDKYDQRASATVTFTVTAKSKDKDLAPQPQTLTGRAFAGAAVEIVVPLNGIDPDGDSVALTGIGSAPSLGRITGTTGSSFTYQAYEASAGTDTFTYIVEDTAGKTATGTISVGVIPRPSTVKPPTAVDDKIEVKPGKTAAVPVLLNDSDPNGYELSLKPKLPEVQEPLVAKVSGALVLITAPNNEGAYVVRYQVTNGQGGSATAFVQVLVTNDAKPIYPSAADHVITIEQLTGKSSITVNALDGASNPSGVASDLTVAVKGANASAGDVQPNGKIVVTPSDHRMAITYSVTDETTGLAGEAFVVVPPKPGSAEASTAPPSIKPGLTEIVKMNGTGEYTLSQIITVPSGRPAKITKEADVSATNAAGSPWVSTSALKFTGAKDYRGPAAITFRVNDGKDPGMTEDRITLLTLPITVGSADQSDVPPTFTPPSVQVEAGEDPQVIDLRDSTFQPNPQVLAAVTYSDFSSSNSEVVSSPSGSKLSLSAPFGVQPGAVSTITFTVNSGEFHIPGQVNVRVVSSSRPLAYQKSVQKIDFKRGGAGASQNGAVSETYWINPFPNQALTIIAAKAASAPAGVTVSFTANSITVSASTAAKTGDVNVTYTVQDATKDPARNVTGQLTATIHDVPDAPPAPSTSQASGSSDGQVKMTIAAPSDNHGLSVTKYEIKSTPNDSDDVVTATGNYTAKGLRNGQGYTFQVRAYNSDGWGAWSDSSNTVIPYGTPAAPASATISNPGNDYGPASLKLTWTAPGNTGGGNVTYEVSYDGGAWTAATSGTTRTGDVGSHSFTVRAINTGSGNTGPNRASNSITVDKKPDPVKSVDLERGSTATCDTGGTCYRFKVTTHNMGNGSKSISFYCNGQKQTTSTTTITTTDGQPTTSPSPWCGYDTQYVIVDGVTSNNADFNP
ncbi:Ig-like domain-containing protein [Lacisediminihabitans changchengi]|uniref:Tandem-95 repeat protein n=1 Tax=Lacisediminihabitans changchengi TaxID=2787634 RepID=A0A934SJ64_9MICO|nr:Ig-like domain-containing protein [Lacisediminihabitans changchengi]MBK4346255.1 tandem-95 repeat protein [Lacisediminihabitans changchengi]